jgi:prepilin signal peptidase PulO-like enzyme (type II secretory pathway)
MMFFFHLLFLMLLGLIFGSLGSVIFFRLGEVPNWKTLKGFLFGRSECRHCHHTLYRQDLIPLRSFFSQRGKCRYCKTKLSRWYPLLEL